MTKTTYSTLRKTFITLILGFFTLFLTGCTDEGQYTVKLYDGDEVMSVFVVDKNDPVALPTLENRDNLVFAAWTDHETYYYDRLLVTKNLDLYAYYETASDVFDYGTNSENQTMGIEGYRGVAKHLTIPQTINDYLVTSIEAHSFQDSELITVRVPIEARIEMFAFLDSKELISVAFYGRYLEYRNETLAAPAYLAKIAEYPDACQIVSGSEEAGTWEFGEGCPIRTVLEKKTIVVLGGVEYINYRVLWDLNVEGISVKWSIQSKAFYGADNLTRVTLPKDESVIIPDAFEGCPQLVDIIIPEGNAYFTTVDHVIYSKDLSTLILYPNGLNNEVFEIPESVTTIRSHAFMGNTAIKELIISQNVEDMALNGLFGLISITVDSNNSVYTTIDGVLFDHDSLVKYPAMKTTPEYIVPAHITTLGGYAFQGTQYLTKITLNEGLRTIGDQCFSHSNGLLQLELPQSVESLGAQVFIESDVSTLLVQRSVVTNGSITTVWLNPLFTMTSEFAIYVPDDSLSTYLGHWTWDMVRHHIYAMSSYQEE